MDLGNTHLLDLQLKVVQSNIREREREIERLQIQHDIPAAWFDERFNAKTHDFQTDAVKEAYMDIIRYQSELTILEPFRSRFPSVKQMQKMLEWQLLKQISD